MKVVITGGAGFLGSRLARAILERGSLLGPDGSPRAVSELLLLDQVAATGFADPRVHTLAGDVADPAVLERAISLGTASVFHLAAIVSGQAEEDFDLGLRVNFDATRRLLERCRALGTRPRVVFTSSLAVYGGPLPDPVPDGAELTPQSSYGIQKAMGELLVDDYSRKGFVDGRSLRLPTVCVRPGKPNRAASSFASGIIREPLSGVDAPCPVGPETRMLLQSPRTVIANLLHAHELPAEAFAHHRALALPGITISVADMVAALREVAGDAIAARVKWEFDPRIDRIVRTWPARVAADRARALGFESDAAFADIIRAYMADDMPRA